MPVTRRSNTNKVEKAATNGRATSDDEQIRLPTEANVPPSTLLEYATLIFGEKGVGKSSLAAELAKSSDYGVTFMFEKGRRNLSIFQIPEPAKGKKAAEPPLTWARFKKYCPLLKERAARGQRVTPVIDTFDRAYECCFKYVCKNMGIASPAALGKDAHEAWTAIKHEFEEVMADLIQHDIIPIFTSHSILKEVSKPDGAEFSMLQPSLSGAPFNIAKSITDLAIYIGTFNGTDRVMCIRGSQSGFIWAACNLEGRFLTPDGEEVFMIYGGKSPKQMAENLLAGFNNKLEDYSPEPPAEEEAQEQEEEDKPPPRKRKK